jgi:Protein of unknown function (DUF2975)
VGRLTVVALRAVLAMALAGSLLVQAVLVPLMAIDLEEADPDVAHLQVPFAVLMVLIILTAQVFVVCVWRLVTMARRGTVFSDGMVFLVCGGSLLAAGIALVVLVMRTLLAQAISREVEAHELRAELDEVI